MKYLGVDYGKKKIGLALSEGNLASPFKIVETSGLKDALDKILHIIKAEGVGVAVIGVAESGEARFITQKFIQGLKKKIKDVEIVEASETLSSSLAQSEMIKLGVGKNKRQREDAFSAAIILQNFLDK